MPYLDDRSSYGGGVDSQPGMMIRKSGYVHQTWLPQWSVQPTVYKPYPEVLPSGEFGDLRLSANEGDFGDWVTTRLVVRRAGVGGAIDYTFICRDPGEKTLSPYERFYQAIRQQLKTHNPSELPPEWWTWFEGGKQQNKRNMIDSPELCAMIQGAMLWRPNSDGEQQPFFDRTTGEPMSPVIMLLPKSARKTLEALLNRQYDNIPPEKLEDFNSRFVVGDLLNPESGRTLMCYKGQKSQDGFTKYEHALGDAYSLPPEKVRGEWVPWRDLLEPAVPPEQQLQILVTITNAASVDYVFRGSDLAHLLPENVRGAWDAYCGHVQVAGGYNPSSMRAPSVPSQVASTPAPPTVPGAPVGPMPAPAVGPSSPAAPGMPAGPVPPSAGPIPPSVPGAPVAPIVGGSAANYNETPFTPNQDSMASVQGQAASPPPPPNAQPNPGPVPPTMPGSPREAAPADAAAHQQSMDHLKAMKERFENAAGPQAPAPPTPPQQG